MVIISLHKVVTLGILAYNYFIGWQSCQPARTKWRQPLRAVAKGLSMKCYEVKKGYDPESYGKAMMAIEGPLSRINAAEKALVDEGFTSTQCAEDGDKDGDLTIFYVVRRDAVSEFRSAWKKVKAAA